MPSGHQSDSVSLSCSQDSRFEPFGNRSRDCCDNDAAIRTQRPIRRPRLPRKGGLRGSMRSNTAYFPMESSQKTVTEVSQQAVPLGSSVLSEIAGEVERKVLREAE